MKSTKVTKEDGCTYSTNWMLDETIESFEKRELNNGDNDELIKELTVQKIEYGRGLIANFFSKGAQRQESMRDYYENLDSALRNQIELLDRKPKQIYFLT